MNLRPLFPFILYALAVAGAVVAVRCLRNERSSHNPPAAPEPASFFERFGSNEELEEYFSDPSFIERIGAVTAGRVVRLSACQETGTSRALSPVVVANLKQAFSDYKSYGPEYAEAVTPECKLELTGPSGNLTVWVPSNGVRFGVIEAGGVRHGLWFGAPGRLPDEFIDIQRGYLP